MLELNHEGLVIRMKILYSCWSAIILILVFGSLYSQTPSTPSVTPSPKPTPSTPSVTPSPKPTTSSKWCVPKTSGVSDAQLQENLDYACGHGIDCSAIQPGGACFDPNTVASHAAYAMNLYYHTVGSDPVNCDFSQTATLTSSNPSKFPYKAQISTINLRNNAIMQRTLHYKSN